MASQALTSIFQPNSILQMGTTRIMANFKLCKKDISIRDVSRS